MAFICILFWKRPVSLLRWLLLLPASWIWWRWYVVNRCINVMHGAAALLFTVLSWWHKCVYFATKEQLKKQKIFAGDYCQKCYRASNCCCLFCNFSRETRIGAKEKSSGNQRRPELKNSREFRNEQKTILVGKTGAKNENYTRKKQNRCKRVKCKTIWNLVGEIRH